MDLFQRWNEHLRRAAQRSGESDGCKPGVPSPEASQRLSATAAVAEERNTNNPTPSFEREGDRPRSMPPPKRSKARSHPAMDNGWANFDRSAYQKGQHWSPDDEVPRRCPYKSNVTSYQRQLPSSGSLPQPRRRSAPPPALARVPTPADDDPVEIIKQCETRPISQEQLVAEVKAIYAGLVEVESKCVEVDNNQSSQRDLADKRNDDQWQALIALHRTLLGKHHDFFLASQPTATSPALRRLVAKNVVSALMNNVPTSISRKAVPSASQTSQEDHTSRFSLGQPGFDSTKIRDRRVCGVINGMRIEALPDTGADESFISARFLKRLKRRKPTRGQPPGPGMDVEEIETENEAAVQLASGKWVTCTSMVSIPWTFEGESRVHWLTCRVLPKSSQDLILGDAFLRVTETLTIFKHRISTRLRSLATGLFRLNYMGHDRRRLSGYLHGDFVAALPDSGSDIMAISADYARRRGFHVNHGHDDQVMVQFADGSTAWTDGVVRNLEWEFGLIDSRVASDFYVLENLPVDVLVSSDFVFDHDVFGQHDNALSHYDGMLDVLHLCNIRLIGRYRRDLKSSEEEELIDLTSPDAFSPLMVQRELARRDAVRDIIVGLPAAEQAPAQQAETERQRQWEQWRAWHARAWAGAAAHGPLPGPHTTTQDPQQAAAASTGRMGRFVGAGRWARKTWKGVSIPLIPLPKRAAGSESVV